jgi:hypothetical protein
MRPDRPVIGGVICLAIGLALILVYCNGTSSASLAYPFAGSNLHIDLTTRGSGVPGGLVFTALGVLFLVWALIAAFVSQISLLLHRGDRMESIFDRRRPSSFESDTESEPIRWTEHQG